MPFTDFPTSYEEILRRIDRINPVEYAQARNFLHGAVTGLSPYISRGVISPRMVINRVLENGFTIHQAEKLIQELAWREYFQQVWQYLGDDIFEDIRKKYTGILHKHMPEGILTGTTGIEVIDNAIQDLYQTGYVHNHARMYIASVTCNIARAHWPSPSQWMYYHLLDGDPASNTCSWQWVAGTFSSRQYFCNQDNINKYSGTVQKGTFLDKPYEELQGTPVPRSLQNTVPLSLSSNLPANKPPETDERLPLLLYTSFNLDPLWRSDMAANRILLLEPSHFRQFPVSEKVMEFILSLAGNIKGLRVFTGEVNQIPGLQRFPAIYSKEHPLAGHFPGYKDERDRLFPEITGLPSSFYHFWKKGITLFKGKYEQKKETLKRA